MKREARWRLVGLGLLASVTFAACGRTRRESSKGDAANAASPGANGGGDGGAGPSPSVSFTSGRDAGGAAGNAANPTGGEATLSEAGAGGSPSRNPEVSLCLDTDQIPAEWEPAGMMQLNGHSCAVGVEGEFLFDGCRYELLSPTPADVDPFVGGHSHCCYDSRLIACP